jgi:tetratricopeptide (TPR) repeat protein
MPHADAGLPQAYCEGGWSLLRLLRGCWSIGRDHPRVRLAVLVPTALAGLLLGWYGWADSEWRAALRALDRDRYDEARDHLRWYRRLCPRSVKAVLLAARVERLDGDYPAAEGFLAEAARMQGGASAESQDEWLLLRCQRGEVDEVAPGLWNCVIRREARAPVILETLAKTYLYQARYHEALRCLHEWLQIEPDSPRALFLSAGALERLGSSRDAIVLLKRVVELAPDHPAARLQLASLYLVEVEPDAAYEHLKVLHDTLPDSPEVESGLARCLALQGRLDEACRLFDAVYATRPDHLPTLLGRAKLELQRNRPADAEAWSRRALKVNSNDPEVHFTLFRSLQAQGGRESEALVHKQHWEALKGDFEKLHELLRHPPNELYADLETATEVGECFLRIGQEPLGLQWLYGTLERAPNHRRAHEVLANYFEKNGELDKARQHRQAIK